MFNPKTEEEIQKEMTWPAGDYDFDIVACDRKVSKNSGKDMLEVTLEVFHPDGGSQRVRDWLVASDAPLCLMKLRHYCRSLNALAAYESGDLAEFPGVGSAGRCKLRVEESEQYGSQNRVADYLVIGKATTPPQKPQGVPASQTKRANAAAVENGMSEDPDIPF